MKGEANYIENLLEAYKLSIENNDLVTELNTKARILRKVNALQQNRNTYFLELVGNQRQKR